MFEVVTRCPTPQLGERRCVAMCTAWTGWAELRAAGDWIPGGNLAAIVAAGPLDACAITHRLALFEARRPRLGAGPDLWLLKFHVHTRPADLRRSGCSRSMSTARILTFMSTRSGCKNNVAPRSGHPTDPLRDVSSRVDCTSPGSQCNPKMVHGNGFALPDG